VANRSHRKPVCGLTYTFLPVPDVSPPRTTCLTHLGHPSTCPCGTHRKVLKSQLLPHCSAIQTKHKANPRSKTRHLYRPKERQTPNLHTASSQAFAHLVTKSTTPALRGSFPSVPTQEQYIYLPTYLLVTIGCSHRQLQPLIESQQLSRFAVPLGTHDLQLQL